LSLKEIEPDVVLNPISHKFLMKMNGTKSLRNPKNPSKDQTRDSKFLKKPLKKPLKKRGIKLDKTLNPIKGSF
jgi:hypothetical protein